MFFFVVDRFLSGSRGERSVQQKADVVLDRWKLSLLGELEGRSVQSSTRERRAVSWTSYKEVVCLSICINILGTSRKSFGPPGKFSVSRLQGAIQMKQVETDLKPVVARLCF